jgi:hypothetical protein
MYDGISMMVPVRYPKLTKSYLYKYLTCLPGEGGPNALRRVRVNYLT